MKYLKITFFLLLVLFSFPALAGKKAKIITESGKKWDVLFIKMSKDTIFLKARKPSGAIFSISGHKSKFRKVEFADGSLLDFSLSDFPPGEGQEKTGENVIASAQGDTVFLAPPPQNRKDTVSLTNQSTTETPLLEAAPFSPWASQTAPDTGTMALAAADTAGQHRITEKKEEKSANDSEAVISVETKPSKALVRIDGNQIEGTTPLIAKHLTIGRHTLVAYNDTLQASKIITLGKGELKRLSMTLEKSKTEKSAVSKKKGRGLAFSLGALSILSFAGSAGTYYLYGKDHHQQLQTFEYLNNSSVKGPGVEYFIAKNKAQHDDAQMKLNISQILLGTGALFLVAGIILYF